MIFDIKLSGESDGYITYHHPVLSPLPIRPYKLKLPGPAVPTQVAAETQYTCELCILLIGNISEKKSDYWNGQFEI